MQQYRARMLPLVSLHQVSKHFGQAPHPIHALESVNLSLYAGEFTALCGASGSGKSTLLNLIAGIDKPSAGSIYLLGNDLNTLSDPAAAKLRAKSIGFVFQFFNLLPVLSVFDNIYYPLMLNGFSRKRAQESVMEMIEKVGLLNHYTRPPAELSGGQQQRVAIARALVKKPELIVADEPTGNLDSKTGQEIIELLLSINQEFKTAFVISTHSNQLREQASRVIEIEDGKIKQSD